MKVSNKGIMSTYLPKWFSVKG